MAVFAVGDIHGCLAPLRQLLSTLRFNPRADKLWLVGDVVNRGPQSLDTLRFLHEHRDCITLTLGNHDLHLLAGAVNRAHLRPNDTLDDILNAPDGETLCDWLRQQPLAHYDNGWLMVHAGVLPGWSTAQVCALADEAHTLIGGAAWRDFVPEMYGNEPAQWDDALEGAARARVIINALTRMRICTAEGAMRLDFTGAPETIPNGYVAWLDAPQRKSAETPILCGHWSALGLVQRNNVNALDSGCLWGGQLTALCLDDGSVHQVDGARTG